MTKKKSKKKFSDVNQKSFYFEDFIETNLKKKNLFKSQISEDRIYVLFFVFFCLISIFSFKIIFISFQDPQFLDFKKTNFTSLRRDIVDRNGVLISRNIKAYHAAVRPNLIKDKKNFLLKVKINFPEISQARLKKGLSSNKWFYLKKRLTDVQKNKLWMMGEKGIEFESYQSRIYPHADLYSHILGQIDDDNFGVSGVESYFDKELKDFKKINSPLKLSLDTNIQYLIHKELKKSMKDFQAKGAAGILIENTTGEVLSLVSLPDYNINLRKVISDKKYINKITKGLYELGSVFKTFTVALALNEGILDFDSKIKDISNIYKCSIHEIKDIHQFPKEMTVEDILIQSSNVGALKIARKIGKEKYKTFLHDLNLVDTPDFELDEVATPLKLDWKNACKLETVSFGHGIMTTPLQVAAAYGTITNGGFAVKPTLKKNKEKYTTGNKKIISFSTSKKMNKLLRKVVTDEKGTASLANVFGFEVGGKTGTAQNYQRKNENINTFVSVFPSSHPKYVMLILLDNPKPAPHIVYNYRGNKVKVNRNEAGWNSVYVSGKIIEKIGPILAINNNELYTNHVVKKSN